MRTRRLLAAAVLAAALTGLAGCTGAGIGDPASTGGQAGPGGGPAGGGPPVDPGQARAALNGLPVAPQLSMAGYSRDRFHIWAEQGDGCDTRQTVLKRDGTNVQATKACRITAGTWVSPYDRLTITEQSRLDIDHVVPLADAWRSGAKNWTDDRRTEFANDLTDPQLLAVSATTNRAKGDQDPSTWKPPNQDFWCTYAQDWIAVKARWQLTVTNPEKAALDDMLGRCS